MVACRDCCAADAGMAALRKCGAARWACVGPCASARQQSNVDVSLASARRRRALSRGLAVAWCGRVVFMRCAGQARRGPLLSGPPLDRRIARPSRCPGHGLRHRPRPVLTALGCGLRAVPGHRPLALALHASRRLRKQMFNHRGKPAERHSHACNFYHPSAPCGHPISHGRSPRTPRGLTQSRC